jgi:hypothetical protein
MPIMKIIRRQPRYIPVVSCDVVGCLVFVCINNRFVMAMIVNDY